MFLLLFEAPLVRHGEQILARLIPQLRDNKNITLFFKKQTFNFSFFIRMPSSLFFQSVHPRLTASRSQAGIKFNPP